MRAILIDPQNKEVKEIQIENEDSLQDYYKYMECDMVERIVFSNREAQIVLDENGCYKNNNEAFFFRLTSDIYPNPYLGKAILTGYDFTELPNNYTKELIERSIIWIKGK